MDSIEECPPDEALHRRSYVEGQFQHAFIKEYEKNGNVSFDPCYPTHPHTSLNSLKSSLNDYSQANFRVQKTVKNTRVRPTTVYLVCDKYRSKRCPAFANAMATDEGWMIVSFNNEHNHDFEDSVAYYKVIFFFILSSECPDVYSLRNNIFFLNAPIIDLIAICLPHEQDLPDRFVTKAVELFQEGKSVYFIHHILGDMHCDEMRAKGVTSDYKTMPCTYSHLRYRLIGKTAVVRDKSLAHRATDFVAALEKKAHNGEIQFDWCPGSCGELKNAVWTTKGIQLLYSLRSAFINSKLTQNYCLCRCISSSRHAR